MDNNYFCDWTCFEKNTPNSSRHPRDAGGETFGAANRTNPGRTVGVEAIRRLVNLLESNAEPILSAALLILQRNGPDTTQKPNNSHDRRRLKALYGLIVACVREQRLMPITSFVRDIGNDRLPVGYDIGEMQAALNALEEVTWKVIIRDMKTANVAYSLGSINTVLGVAKDASPGQVHFFL